MIIVYHVQRHVIEVLKDFKIRSLSRYVTVLPSLVAIGSVSGDIIVLVCHVISKDHEIKESC